MHPYSHDVGLPDSRFVGQRTLEWGDVARMGSRGDQILDRSQDLFHDNIRRPESAQKRAQKDMPLARI